MAQSVIVKNKEIRVKNPQMVVEDENRAELIEFTITNAYSIEDVEGMIFYVQYRNKLGEVGMDTLVNAYPSDIVHNDMLVLDWLPSASFTKERGKIEIQIVGFTESLQPTSDTTYQSGKVYFSDSNGTFLPVYPSTSEHSPKVGDTITGTVYENQVTGDDHRWSTEKCQLLLPENIYDNGTPVYTEAQVKNLITQMNEQVLIATTNALKSEGFAVGEQNGTEVGSDSPYYHDNAKYYKEQAEISSGSASTSATEASESKTDAENARDKAHDWATKTNGKVDNIDYSAKHYAGQAGNYAEDADNARIVSVSETQSPDDGGTNVVVITYKDGTTFTFFVRNGNAGTPFTIYKTYSSIAEMNADFANVPEGRFVIISSSVSDPDNSKMFVRGAEAFTFVTDLSGAQGIQGPAGQAATITVGTVSTGAAGSSASIVNSGTSSAAVFDFVIPRGDKGEQGIQGIQGEKGDTGNTPVLSIGSVTYGDTPTVTIDTTDPDNPVLNFVLKTSEVGVVDNLNSSSAVDALSARQGSLLKSAIDNNSQRIENLEVAVEGTLVQPNTDSTMANTKTITNANSILPWAILKRVGARAVAWNQFGKLRETTYYNCSEPDADGYQKISLKYTETRHARCGINGNDPLPLGHKVLAVMQSKTSGALTGTKWFMQNSDDTEQYSQITADNNTVITTTTYARSVITVNWEPYFTSNPTAEIEVRVQVFDLTANRFNDLYDTDSLRKTNFLRQFPSSVYYPVNLGEIIPLNPSAFKVVGKNKWDEEWEVGSLSAETGLPINDNNKIRSKNYTVVIPSTSYYILSGFGIQIFEYDINHNYLNRTFVTDSSITMLASTKYIKFRSADGVTSYSGGILICLNSVTDKTYEEHKETTIDTSFTSDYKYVNENCHDYSENILVDGVIRRKEHKGIVGSYKFTGTENLEYTSQRWRIQISGIKRAATGASIGNLSLATYLATSTSVLSSDKSQRYVAVDNSSDYVYLVNPNALNSSDLATMQANLTGKTLYFENANPSTPTLHDPIPNIPCEDGTTVQAVTPQTDLVNSIDVPSTIAYMTKIGG